MEFPFRAYNIVSVFSLCVYLCIPARCVFCPIFFEKKVGEKFGGSPESRTFATAFGNEASRRLLRSGH